jgi:hypothetical protein
MAKVIKKAQSGILSTKLKDVPGKVKKAATNVKDAVSAGFNKTVNKVKNTTVGDALKFVANPSYSAAESAVKSLNKGKSSSKKPILKSKHGGKIIKKAQNGLGTGDGLRTGQYKRLGRIDEKNPARAERVADRMNTRATRVSRGKNVANPSIFREIPMTNMKLSLERDKFEKESRKRPIEDDKIYKKGENPYKTDKNGKVIMQKFGGKTKMKAGGMLKRADGSYSKRGLWDNIRANKGSGKKPTAQMLKQEKKIKAKTK